MSGQCLSSFLLLLMGPKDRTLGSAASTFTIAVALQMFTNVYSCVSVGCVCVVEHVYVYVHRLEDNFSSQFSLCTFMRVSRTEFRLPGMCKSAFTHRGVSLALFLKVWEARELAQHL